MRFKVQFKVQNYTVQSAVSNFDVSPCANTFLMLVLLFHESDYQAPNNSMANIVEKLKQFLDQNLINVRFSTNKCRNLSKRVNSSQKLLTCDQYNNRIDINCNAISPKEHFRLSSEPFINI